MILRKQPIRAALISRFDRVSAKLARPAAIAALCVCSLHGSVAANDLISVRVGPHKNFDRMVFEFESEAPSYVQFKGEQRLEVLFKNVGTRKEFALPALPKGLVAIRGVDAFRVGDNDIAFEIELVRDVTPSELPLSGTPFRLAVDLAPKAATDATAKPEYIPGDKPIPTRFADVNNPDTAQPPDNTDPAKANSILAYYFLSQGDTEAAQNQASTYYKMTGEKLDIPTVSVNGKADQAHQHALTVPAREQQAALWWMILISALAGLIGGAGGAWAVTKLSKREPAPAPDKLAATPRELSQELQHDIAALKATVKEQAPTRAVETHAAVAAIDSSESEDQTKESQESLMDRRVRRVLDLSQQGKSAAEIAEELEMAQDEVKLILDLNM
jgi:hypothetical protein